VEQPPPLPVVEAGQASPLQAADDPLADRAGVAQFFEEEGVFPDAGDAEGVALGPDGDMASTSYGSSQATSPSRPRQRTVRAPGSSDSARPRKNRTPGRARRIGSMIVRNSTVPTAVLGKSGV
jgi:hypothetical protein